MIALTEQSRYRYEWDRVNILQSEHLRNVVRLQLYYMLHLSLYMLCVVFVCIVVSNLKYQR